MFHLLTWNSGRGLCVILQPVIGGNRAVLLLLLGKVAWLDGPWLLTYYFFFILKMVELTGDLGTSNRTLRSM